MRDLLSGITRWPVLSQRVSQQNARRAAEELAASRLEREQVERDVSALVTRSRPGG